MCDCCFDPPPPVCLFRCHILAILLFTTTRYQICAPCIVLHYTSREELEGRDEELRKGGWLSAENRETARERVDGSKEYGRTFSLFELGLFFAYLDFGAIWDDTVPARLSAVFVLGAGMVKDSSPGGMNHPHVFKYPHDRADFREISVVPILRRLTIYAMLQQRPKIAQTTVNSMDAGFNIRPTVYRQYENQTPKDREIISRNSRDVSKMYECHIHYPNF